MQPSQPVLALLREVRAFSALDDAGLRLLSERMEPRVYPPGAFLCREGEAGDRMFIIESGNVAVLKQQLGGTPVEVTVLGPGAVAGEMSLFGPAPRSASLLARAETRAWVLAYASFQEVLAQDSALALGLLSYVSSHLRRQTSVVARLLAREPDQRFRVAFFDSKPYMEAVFQERNRDGYALSFFDARLSPETAGLAAGFQAICVFVNDSVDAEVVAELRGLGVGLVALRCAGFNNVDLEACARHQIDVVRVPAYSPHAVAEHAVALMLALNRRLHRAHNRVREGNFSLAGLVGFDMHGKTAGIVGTGKIGKCLAAILNGFGCRLLAFDKYPETAWAEGNGVRYVEWPELLTQSDIISLHAPLTPGTRHLIDAAAIAKMKRGVMLINTSRGALIDTAALLEGLKSGQIGFAGLDVYEEESEYFFEDRSDQVIGDDLLARLLTFNNVLTTGHQAFLTREALEAIADVTFESLREFQSGKRGAALTHRVAALTQRASERPAISGGRTDAGAARSLPHDPGVSARAESA